MIKTVWKAVKPHPQQRWKLDRQAVRTLWTIRSIEEKAGKLPVPDIPKHKHIPAHGEPLAYCSICKDWTPMQWRPVRERGKRAEQWFQCEYCGCRELALRHLSGKDAVAKNQQYANRA